jgi:hypothetical protein
MGAARSRDGISKTHYAYFLIGSKFSFEDNFRQGGAAAQTPLLRENTQHFEWPAAGAASS